MAVRFQHKVTKDLYAKRAKAVAEIPNFWPLVIEQAPPDIDEYVQPSDANLLLNSLKGVHVERFELPEGDPRSFSVKMEFAENEFFEDSVLEKKFWWRNAQGWAGHVSEPVDIKWKEGKDLTNGMLGLVKQIFDDEAAGNTDETEAKKKLKTQMESTALDGLSFFAWFGFRGRKVSLKEHEEATKKLEERRKARKEGKADADAMEEDEEDDDDDEYEYEIFPTGDDLAVCIAEDLWPGAIKYFRKSRPQQSWSRVVAWDIF
jgi:hypothetical protein